MTALELVVYALLLAVAAAAVWRRPSSALYLFVVGLALHNAAMAALYAAGVRGVDAHRDRRLEGDPPRRRPRARHTGRVRSSGALPFRPSVVDWLALAYGALVVVYARHAAVRARRRRGRSTRSRSRLKHDLVPVGAFFLGRSLRLGRDELRRLAWTLLGTAAFVAALGIVDVYAVPIGWWRTNGVVDYFHKQLGYHYNGTRRTCRRTSSTTPAPSSTSCGGSSRRSSARSRPAT